MLTIVEVLQRTDQYFRKLGIASPRLDTELLMGHVLGMDRLRLYLEHDRPLTQHELDVLRKLVRRRASREPMAYILGTKGFYNHDFVVDKHVLCPRPDTETLVEACLPLLKPDQTWYLADIGCGSGCIGLSLTAAHPGVRLYATDISDHALECTRKNTEKLELSDRVAILKGPFLEPIPPNRPIDIVLSNPPYIPTADIDQLEPEVSVHEPRMALDGGPDGLDLYRQLLPKAASRARVAVLVEVGQHQAEHVAALMQEQQLSVTIHKDLAGIQRVVMGTHQSA